MDTMDNLTPKYRKDNNYFKFPRTKHIVGLGCVERDDLLLTTGEQNMFLNKLVYVEEKIDGANMGISVVRETMKIKYQNRAHEINSTYHQQFWKLDQWEQIYGKDIYDILEPDNHILFGEWMYLKHGTPYNKLPSYFVVI